MSGHKVVSMIKSVMSRYVWLYVIVALLVWKVVDHKAVLSKTLNFIVGTDQGLLEFAQEQRGPLSGQEVREVERYFLTMKKMFPQSVMIRNAMALTRYWQGDLDGAEKWIRECLDVLPASSWLWYDLGVVCSEQGDYECARSSFQKVLNTKLDALGLQYQRMFGPYLHHGVEGQEQFKDRARAFLAMRQESSEYLMLIQQGHTEDHARPADRDAQDMTKTEHRIPLYLFFPAPVVDQATGRMIFY